MWRVGQAYPWVYVIDELEETGSWYFADTYTTERGHRFFRVDTQEWLRVEDLRPSGPVSHHFVRIPGGEFQMGDSHNHADLAWARPVRDVYVGTFEIAAHLVTYAEWKLVHDWAVENGYTFESPVYNGSTGPTSSGLAGWHTGMDKNMHPAVNFTWYDAVKWCNARSEMEGLQPAYYTDSKRSVVYRSGDEPITSEHVHWEASGYRLPTEAEWEKAARGGLVGKRWPWGNDTPRPDLGNFWTAERDDDGHGTAPVGRFPPNGYGLYDLCGNVAQWCWDRFEATWYADPSASVTDPRGPDDRNHHLRAARGSSWRIGVSQPSLHMSSYRAAQTAARSFVNRNQMLVGIRLVRGPQRGGNR